MVLLQVAAIEDAATRREQSYLLASFMLRNARQVCEEWCRPENAELRQRKFLRLREETLLTCYNPSFTPDTTVDFREMYGTMADRFRQMKEKILGLIYLMKTQLFDNPSRSTFMTWVGIAMIQSESYSIFKRFYNPKGFMKMDAAEFSLLRDGYLSLNAPVGVKKIPVVFMLFELPRFFYYAEFLNKRLGIGKYGLMEKHRAELASVTAEDSMLGWGREAKRGKKRTLVCLESHFENMLQQQEFDQARLYLTFRYGGRCKWVRDMSF